MNKHKPILAIETSESLCGAAVYIDDKVYFESNIYLKNSHAEKLFGVIDNVMNASGLQINDLGCLAVSAGPGSFTGLRIGMSAAKGIAFGASLPIVAVPTFEALALQLVDYLPDGTTFVVANKVNSEEIYYAKFQIISNNYIFVDDLTILTQNSLAEKVDGIPVYGNVSGALFTKQRTQCFRIPAPNPYYLAKWCRLYGNELLTFDYDYLEPNYLKNFFIKERKHA